MPVDHGGLLAIKRLFNIRRVVSHRRRKCGIELVRRRTGGREGAHITRRLISYRIIYSSFVGELCLVRWSGGNRQRVEDKEVLITIRKLSDSARFDGDHQFVTTSGASSRPPE